MPNALAMVSVAFCSVRRRLQGRSGRYPSSRFWVTVRNATGTQKPPPIDEISDTTGSEASCVGPAAVRQC